MEGPRRNCKNRENLHKLRESQGHQREPVNNLFYYMAGSTSGQDESNPVL